MSSTTERRAERGQVLAVFALMSVVIIGMAALAFDVGMVTLERRGQQNAADAAALAGARFLPGNSGQANSRAIALASANGYPPAAVTVSFPASTRIRVTINSTQPSLFAGVMGILGWDVAATAVAANEENSFGPFALLSLHPTECYALLVEGKGVVESWGNIQVNSTCSSAVRVAGTGSLDLKGPGISCNVTGGVSSGGGTGVNHCSPSNANTGAAAIPDPYADLPYPPKPPIADPPLQVGGTAMAVPDGCPGAGTGLETPAPASLDPSASPSPAPSAEPTDPAACRFPGSYKDTIWRLYPGYYPGGINLEAGTFYMEPGIYYVAGGIDPGGGVGPVSFRAAGSGVVVRSVAKGGTTLDWGVMIFNGVHETLPDGKIVLGGAGAQIDLFPLNQGTTWDNIVIFQHRDITLDVYIAGGNSDMQVRGVIYVPSGKVVIEGNNGTLTMDQIIASTFSVKGNGGTIRLAYDSNFLPDFSMAGLIE